MSDTFEVHIRWGAHPENEPASTYNFATQQELDAFMHGVDEAAGWMDYKVIEPDEDYEQMQSDFDSGECAVIHHNGTVTFCGKTVGQFNEYDDMIAAIKQAMEDKQYWPSIYSVNDHGNVSLLDSEGHEIKGWV